MDRPKPTASSLTHQLTQQFEIAWQLTEYHLSGLTNEECLWRPAVLGLHVLRGDDNLWRAQWPEHEGYDLGPPSIAWVTWHIGFWWSMTINHTWGDRSLSRETIFWPGDAEQVRAQLSALKSKWLEHLAPLTDEDLESTKQSNWPLQNKPLRETIAWLNLELMKNAAELGLLRFLHATRPQPNATIDSNPLESK